MIQGASIQLNGEPVLVTPEQVACAERADLLIVLPMGGRSVGQFNDAGRALGFSDDIHIGDPDYPMPYTQVRGKFTLYPSNVILTDVDENTKMAEAQTRVRIDHKCFEQPPPRLMGVYKGRFSATQNPSFSFRRRGDWWEFVSLKH